eukprot:gnl/TRDRNA2_/TRDRNA2_173882_c8_seq1.p1 gnl/TRDRNA2_/TRDRNA2_173882_c8~~gnl/TRDRNA2_/TRDRNA2_173882_c8_seq1.p1  ORF type:complete len:303 (+),score=51.86 gnl/TRDRNA2_/TRDRNA2_173882_c8_seq1:120-1028(+)
MPGLQGVDGDAAPAEATCNFDSMALGNQKGIWKTDKASIKYTYDNDLKGLEVKNFWPGRTTSGECNDSTDVKRGCWYRARLLNDPTCSEEKHCLHVAYHDGEPSLTYTCPTWIRNSMGQPCALPKRWQACPVKFEMLRANSSDKADFEAAIGKKCVTNLTPVPGQKPPADEPSCLSNFEDLGKMPPETLKYYFVVRANKWYRCNPQFRCELFDIKAIKEPQKGMCGTEACASGSQCFEHRLSDVRSTSHCVGNGKVFVFFDGDVASKMSMPSPLLLAAAAKSCPAGGSRVVKPSRAQLASFL